MSESLSIRLAKLRELPDDPELEFYALSLTADDRGRISFGMQTMFVGWQSEDCRVEMRQGRLLRAGFHEAWSGAGLSSIFVIHPDDLIIFLLVGGNALVERRAAEGAFPDVAIPMPSYRVGLSGFAGSDLLDGQATTRRAPTPKLRMEVLNRDYRRCRICGRRPDDHIDVQLHVHHIRPWNMGGVTDISNLITLCHTCHSGLEPHFDPGLFEYVEQQDGLSHIAQFDEGVSNYRRLGMLGSA